MITAILAGMLAVAAPQQTDTTFDVRPGGRLDIEAFNGSVTIRTWDRTAMRIRETGASRDDIEIERNGSDVVIEASGRWGPPADVRIEVTMPRRFSIAIEGVALMIAVADVQGDVELENVDGSITVRNVDGRVEIESVSGAIVVENVRGDVSATSVNQEVRLTAVTGDISAETVNGAIVMRGIDARHVEANTVNGIVEYDGAIRDGGDYYLGTHNGRITLAIPAGVNARLAIAARNGKVEAAFPVQVRRIDDHEFAIVLGSGSARVELESFNGSVYLVRPSGR